MTESVRFHFDPLCPWCYQTSRWARRLAELGEIELDWGVFSLEIVNAEDGADVRDTARAAAALRTTVLVHDRHGAHGVGRFYAALGARIHERSEDPTDPGTVTGALEDAGLETSLRDEAVGDPATWDRVAEEHHALVERTRSFGVPTIVLDGGTGPAIFGPVVSNVPEDDDAVELFRHVAWLARYDNFSELKRDRTIDPDLESVRRRRADQG
jgi:predicted DsbA family dithiol-disulfide isomerase